MLSVVGRSGAFGLSKLASEESSRALVLIVLVAAKQKKVA